MRFIGRKSPPPGFCVVPWTHTYISPQSERRMCCASREQHSFIHQYIDQPGCSGVEYRPTTLAEHWNGEHMRSVRRRMLAGERLPECEVCNDQVLNLSTYRDWFNKALFPDKIEEALSSTEADGSTSMQPISFDYRLLNECNFKCRMCGEQLSSAWESEKRRADEWSPERDPWMIPEIKAKIEAFQREVVEEEFARALRAGQLEEIYWVGGEPLIWEAHWRYMRELIELGYANKVFCRYNTNLSQIRYKGTHLFTDLLPHFKGYLICASIDGVGPIGEFIRTGLKWDRWLQNFKEGLKGPLGPSAMAIDLTLTLPGLFSVKEMFDLATDLQVQLITKITFAFDPQVVLSPLSLPRQILNPLLEELIAYIEPRVTSQTQSLLVTLQELRSRPNFEEQWPQEYEQAFARGRAYQKKLGLRRGDGQNGRLTMEDILAARPEVLQWWTRRVEGWD